MRIRNCLDTAGVYNIRQAYTPNICYRISWAIIDNGCSFFSTVLIQHNFENGRTTFPESLLDSILPDARYANPIMRANYPKEWQPKPAALAMPPQGYHPATPCVPWTPPPPGPPPQFALPPAPAPLRQQWTDHRHPLIAQLMAPYITKLGDNVYVGEILDAAGMRLTDLPIPTGTQFASKDGTKAYLCWNLVLGRCKFESSSHTLAGGSASYVPMNKVSRQLLSPAFPARSPGAPKQHVPIATCTLTPSRRSPHGMVTVWMPYQHRQILVNRRNGGSDCTGTSQICTLTCSFGPLC